MTNRAVDPIAGLRASAARCAATPTRIEATGCHVEVARLDAKILSLMDQREQARLSEWGWIAQEIERLTQEKAAFLISRFSQLDIGESEKPRKAPGRASLRPRVSSSKATSL